MQVIEQLIRVGYEVSLIGSDIKLKWLRDGDPDPFYVEPLVDCLIANKARAWAWLNKANWKHSVNTCACCGGSTWWRSIYGATACVTCHPPAALGLVLSRENRMEYEGASM